MPSIELRRAIHLFDDHPLSVLFKECTPRVLVVTDGLNFNAGDAFGLTQFVNTLKAHPIHGMLPIVKTASRNGSAGADLTNYRFDDANTGVTRSRYDVVFLMGWASEGDYTLPDAERVALQRFMQAGGGVFATGDHETMGAALCSTLPRVAAMRKWVGADAPPSARGSSRHSTNLSGTDETEEFDDQSDDFPQRLYVNFRTQAGGTATINRAPHPLMQMRPPRRVLEVFPDHPHEGECRLPTALTGTFVLDGAKVAEWPQDAAGSAVAPEMVAYSVSHGDGFNSSAKESLVPRLFGAVAAYDGHRAGVGRVTTDSTWHHFVNINLDGTGASNSGLRALLNSDGSDSEALTRIRQYYVNLATWLMPKKVRRCLRFPLLAETLLRDPLIEELDLPRPPDVTGAVAQAIGRSVLAELRLRLPAYQVQALADDALEDALGERGAATLLSEREPRRFTGLAERIHPMEVAEAAVGGLVIGVADVLASAKQATDIRPHESFEAGARTLARTAVQSLLKEHRSSLTTLGKRLDQWERVLG